MIQLTTEQQRQMKEGRWPPRLVNIATGEESVLLHAAMFERILPILEIAAIEEMYPTLSEVLEGDESASRESA
jgi:hypothetical protein